MTSRGDRKIWNHAQMTRLAINLNSTHHPSAQLLNKCNRLITTPLVEDSWVE
jgi:hypothetical protein